MQAALGPQPCRRKQAPHQVMPQMIALAELAGNIVFRTQGQITREMACPTRILHHRHRRLQAAADQQNPGQRGGNPFLPQRGRPAPAGPGRQRQHDERPGRHIAHAWIIQPHHPRLHMPKGRQQEEIHRSARRQYIQTACDESQQHQQQREHQRTAFQIKTAQRADAQNR